VKTVFWRRRINGFQSDSALAATVGISSDFNNYCRLSEKQMAENEK
jgi:regulation of enolase protein 1 (concanavalin A-like superfamily)